MSKLMARLIEWLWVLQCTKISLPDRDRRVYTYELNQDVLEELKPRFRNIGPIRYAVLVRYYKLRVWQRISKSQSVLLVISAKYPEGLYIERDVSMTVHSQVVHICDELTEESHPPPEWY